MKCRRKELLFSVKTRLWIVVIGVCLGLVGRWVFGKHGADVPGHQQPAPTDANETTDDEKLSFRLGTDDVCVVPAVVSRLTGRGGGHRLPR